jgi:hypothetical protein
MFYMPLFAFRSTQSPLMNNMRYFLNCGQTISDQIPYTISGVSLAELSFDVQRPRSTTWLVASEHSTSGYKVAQNSQNTAAPRFATSRMCYFGKVMRNNQCTIPCVVSRALRAQPPVFVHTQVRAYPTAIRAHAKRSQCPTIADE